MKQKLNLEVKILIYFFIFVVLGFAVIDLISILYIKALVEDRFNLKVKQYKSYYFPQSELPEYIKVSQKPILGKNYIYLGKKDRFYLFIEEKAYKKLVFEPVYRFAFVLFLWEVLLILIFMYLFYKIIFISLKKEQENKKFIETFILAFTHKLGNFLSSLKVNLELLNRKYKDKPIERLNKSYSIIENEFNLSLNLLKNLYFSPEDYQKINIKDLVNEILNQYEGIYFNQKPYLSLKDTKISAKPTEIKILLSILIENAFKYGENIKIKTCKNSLCISNKIANFSNKGAGIGLELAKYIATKNKWQLKGKVSNDKFTVCLQFS